MKIPKVSVIIPVYNASRYIRPTIEGVLNQAFQDFEIIVSDDGSMDNTKEIIEEYRRKSQDKIKYFYQTNQGHAKARNSGIRHAAGEFIAFLDADDVWRKDKLVREVDLLEKNPALGLVHSARVRINGNGEILPTFQINPELLTGQIYENLLFRKAHICTSSVLCRKSCLDTVGYFDEHFPDNIGGEDRELWLRLTKQYQAGFISEPLVQYRFLNHSLSRSRRAEAITRGRYYVIDKTLSSEKNPFKKICLKKMAYSAIHNELAANALEENNLLEAQIEFWRAFCQFPIDVKVLMKWGRTLLVNLNHK